MRDTNKAVRDLQKHKLPYLFSHRECYFVGYDAGIREVVEWMKEHDTGDKFCIVITKDDWDMRPKEWGIE